MNPSDYQRFWSYIKQTDNCWIWTGHQVKNYGRFELAGKGLRAHRLSYELFKGEIPQGMELDHLCRNPSCVNPDHLEAVSHKENMSRSISRCAKQNHCIRGHEFTHKTKQRKCRICININARGRYQKNKEKINTNKRNARKNRTLVNA